MKNRKYPMELFWMGTVVELISLAVVPLLAVVVFLTRIFIPQIPVIFPVLLLVLWPIYALINQLRVRKSVLDNPDEPWAAVLDTTQIERWKEQLQRFVGKDDKTDPKDDPDEKR